ncbi:MAG: hypothetical protein EOO91_12370 [Pedobacter sp.]|nr:MAG: hypothetical protein EOO91_12370 [Pedobacter sp.]
MSNLKITIPKPCTENWGNMKPLEKGRFCESCEKEVLDFTKFSTTELQNYFKYPKGNVCGRINKRQLIDFIPKPVPSNKFKYLSYKLFVASSLTLLTSTKSYSNEFLSNENFFQDDTKSSKLNVPVKHTDTLITISGLVIDNSDGLTVPGVSIAVKGGQNIVTTSIDGKFKIQVKRNANQKVVLVSKYIGYETKETVVDVAIAKNLEIRIEAVSNLLGEITTIVAGGIIVKRSLPNRIGYFFKRIFIGHH